MQYVIDKKWKWVQCNLVIKRLPQKQYQQGIYQSLEAQVQLISQQPDIKNFMSDITMDKTFQFQQGKGFIWHKSWYIPQIVIKLPPKISKMLKDQNHIKKIYCEMLSAYPFKKEEHFYLEQVRLEGDTVKQFSKKGQVTFTNVKFSQTSFNKNKNKFSLILVIYTNYKQNQKGIIKSFISSPIHVDSRKQARKKISANTFIQDEINITKFINPLQGSQKLINQSCSYQDLLTIPGFIKYYTAANVRFKIKHPYYIGYHFNNVFDIYYNSEQAAGPADVLDIIYQNDSKQYDRANVRTKSKKQLYHDNKQILKKNCPKILLFLIKNSPKQCYLVKDQMLPQEEKQSIFYDKQNKSFSKQVKSLKSIDVDQKGISNEDFKQLSKHNKISKQKQQNQAQMLEANQMNSKKAEISDQNKQKQFPPKQSPNDAMNNNLYYYNSSFIHGNNGQNVMNNHNLSSMFSQINPLNHMNANYYYFGNSHPFIFNNNQSSKINQNPPMITDNRIIQNNSMPLNENKQKLDVDQLVNNSQAVNNSINLIKQKNVNAGNENKSQLNQSSSDKKQLKKQKIDVYKKDDIKEEQNSSGLVFNQNKDQNQNNLIKRQTQKNLILRQEEYIRKINSIFQSWKFNFVYIKKSDGGFTILNKKWKHIPKQELLQAFKEYSRKKAQRMNQNQRIDSVPVAPNGNNFLTYDIHQVIVLQKSKHSNVKLQENQFGYDV